MPPAGGRADGGCLVNLLARPWVDPICLWGLGRLLPASVLWARAAKARGDPQAFKNLVNGKRLPRAAEKRLARTEALRRAHVSAQSAWEDIAFGGASGEQIAAAEIVRRRAAQAFLGQRLAYFFQSLSGSPSAGFFDIPSPAAARQELHGALADSDKYFVHEDGPSRVEKGGVVDHGNILEYWLRYPGRTDRTADHAFAHVFEPKPHSSHPVPSVIFCHGLAMELEMLAEGPRDFQSIAKAGVRIVLPDAPGHNRRCPDGCFGGETFIRRAPASAIHHFHAAAMEFAVLIEWCRAQGSAKVALGGISLGALSSQVAATRWAHWPQSSRADYLFLATTTDDVAGLMLNSSLAKVCQLDRAIRDGGWDEEAISAFSPIVNAGSPAPIDPSRIVFLLGERDDLTPIAGGKRLASAWQVPDRNLFLRNQGHFSAAFGLGANPAPFRRLIQILLSD